jgi:hypothetical protein
MQHLFFRPVDMLEEINAPFRWPLPVVDMVSDPSHVLNHYSWTHSRPPSLYWYPWFPYPVANNATRLGYPRLGLK